MSSVPKCTARRDAFDKIDDEESAYWLGFLTCDAHWSKSGILVELSSKSRGHVENLASWIGTPVERIRDRTREITFPNGKTSTHSTSTLLLPGSEYVDAVGYNPKVSGPAVSIPDELKPHFWRGVIDADGTICKRANQTGPGWLLTVCGKRRMVSGFLAFANTIGTCRSSVRGGGRTASDEMVRVNVSAIDTLRAIYSNLYAGAQVAHPSKAEAMGQFWREMENWKDGRFKRRASSPQQSPRPE